MACHWGTDEIPGGVTGLARQAFQPQSIKTVPDRDFRLPMAMPRQAVPARSGCPA